MQVSSMQPFACSPLLTFAFDARFPSAYLTSILNVHPMVIAAHPQEPNQFALGLSDETVHVLKPLESDGRWGVPPPAENWSTSTVPATPPTAGSGSEQPAQR